MTKVRIARRSVGGVVISDNSRSPPIAMCSVRGIGVALSVSTSTSVRSFLMRSLCETPKRCSSSTTSKPRRAKCTSFDNSRCVPITMSVSPRLDARDDFLLLLGRDEARQHLDLDRVVVQARLEREQVLLREHRRRAQHRDLAPAHRHAERRAQRDLGLAEADVAADQAIHRVLALEVAHHVVDRLALIGGLFVREAGLELGVDAVLVRIRAALARGARRVQLQELVGELPDRSAHTRLGPREGLTAEPVELGRRAFLARQLLDLVQARDRQEQLVAARIFDDQHLDALGLLPCSASKRVTGSSDSDRPR